MTARDSITRARARTPGAEDYTTSMAAQDRALGPTQRGITDVATTCAKGGHKPQVSRCMPGAGLSWLSAGRCRPTCRPSSRIGENPPYGMIGRVEETSASFEARSAPRSYPTAHPHESGHARSSRRGQSRRCSRCRGRRGHRPLSSVARAGMSVSVRRSLTLKPGARLDPIEIAVR